MSTNPFLAGVPSPDDPADIPKALTAFAETAHQATTAAVGQVEQIRDGVQATVDAAVAQVNPAQIGKDRMVWALMLGGMSL